MAGSSRSVISAGGLLDGVLSVVVDGQEVAEIGPGAVLGERALLEGGRRTSTLRAATRCRVAVTSAEQLEEAALAAIAGGHLGGIPAG